MGKVLEEIKGSFASLRFLKRRELALLGTADLLDVMSVSIIIPLLPLYAEDLGAGFVLIGIMFTAETFAKAVFATPFGYLSDKLDRRTWIVIGMVFSAVTVILLGFVKTPVYIVGLRFVDGIGSAMRGPSTTAYIGDLFPEENRGKAMGAYYTVGSIGLAVGPGVGGLFATTLGYEAPFIILGTGTLLAGILLALFLPGIGSDDEDDAADESSGSLLPSIPSASTIRRVVSTSFVALAVTGFLSQIGTGVFNPYIASLLNDSVSAGAGYIGLAWSFFGLGMLVFTPIGGTFADRFGRKPMLVVGYGAWALISVGLAYASVWVVPLVLLFAGGASSALLGPALRPLIYEIAPENYEATTIGAYSTLTTTGFVLGPILGGLIIRATSVGTGFVFVGTIYAICAIGIVVGVAGRKSRSKSSVSESV
jgi:MFS family permease